MKIYVKVRPNSNEAKIFNLEDKKYSIYLTSPTEKNKANLELIRLLSKEFSVTAKQIKIKVGLTNKEKIIEIKDEIRKS